MVERLSKEKIASALAYLKNRDTLVMTVTATLAGALGMLTNFGLFIGPCARSGPLGLVGAIVAMLPDDGAGGAPRLNFAPSAADL